MLHDCITPSLQDAKFGFGGKKRFAKSNTSDSTNDFDFSASKSKQLPKGFRGAAKPKKVSSKKPRPGKSKRQRTK
jgi:rRNA-processing protein EBP2